MKSLFAHRFSCLVLSAGCCALFICFPGEGVSRANELEQCLHQQLATAEDTVTIGELRARCRRLMANAPATESDSSESPIVASGAVRERLQQERENVLKPFSILPHKPNFILFGAYNAEGYNAQYHQIANNDDSYHFDKVESQFQISIKSPLIVGLIDDRVDVYAAYTNHSFWQVYNDELSSPFRETNHEPELWVQIRPDLKFLGIRNTLTSLGINHQSNGQSGALSRSWNRLYASFVFEYGNLGFSFTPWYRIPESDADDDNPDITRYLGHYEIGATYKWGEHTFSLMSRNQLESDFERGGLQASWSFPLWGWPYLRGYVQYYYGYGESLIDYNQRVNRLGLGLSLSDWL